MRNKVFKHAAIDDVFPQIEPIKKFLPEFYKNSPFYYDDTSVKNIKELPTKPTFKMCSVYKDSFMTGYSLPLIMDIAVKQTADGPQITWNIPDIDVLQVRSEVKFGYKSSLPIPMGCHWTPFTWTTQHAYQIPEGYSALVTHPLNRYDLPFFTLSGIIDDYVVQHYGNFPVYFSSTFEGIISKGTPIAQILLFKRENWESKKDENILKISQKNRFFASSKANGWYKHNVWKKKTYN
jgi:hypothetical protein